MSFKTTLFGIALCALLVPAAFASSICPAPNGGYSGGEGVSSVYTADTVISGGVVQNNTGCNALITFNSNGSVTTTYPNGAPSYDSGGDDNLIGVLNNTGKSITAINLSSSTYDIFGFDGDGICGGPGYTFVGGGNPCAGATDPYGYGGPGVTYTFSSYYSGTVDFSPGIAAHGGSSFFSLEGPVNLSLGVSTPTPEPSTLSLLGGFLAVLGFARRRLGW